MTSTWRDWAESATGRRVVRARRLRGGITSDVRLVRFDDGETLVLRQWQPKDHGRSSAWIENEAAVLTDLARSTVPAPRLVAHDRAQHVLLMTRLPGRADIEPVDLDGWIRQLADALPAIHDTATTVAMEPRLLDFTQYEPPDDLRARAVAAVRAVELAPTGTLLHGDYQHFNVLWSRRRLTGVVDWAWSSQGHPDLDLGHCRLNLALRFSADVAERFRLAYEAVAGRAVEPAIELARMLGYHAGWKSFLPRQAIGVQLDVDGMDARVDDLVRRTLNRAG